MICPKPASPSTTSKGVMIAGFCVGVGFMVNENSQCFRRVIPDFLSHAQHAGQGELIAETLGFLEFLCFRILLNPHPYLTGIVAGRFAQRVSNRREPQQLSSAMLWQISWPSAALHVLFNLSENLVGRVLCTIILRKVRAYQSAFLKGSQSKLSTYACVGYRRVHALILQRASVLCCLVSIPSSGRGRLFQGLGIP